MKKNLLLVLAIVLTIFFSLSITMDGLFKKSDLLVESPIDKTIIKIDEMYKEDGSVFEIPSILEMKAGSSVKLHQNLSYEFKNNTGPSFIMQANHSFIKVSLNGKVIYEVVPQDHSLGNYFTRIPLPSKLDNALIELTITTPKIGIDKVTIPSIVITNEGQYAHDNLFSDIPSLAITTIILACGIVGIVLVFITKNHDLIQTVVPKSLFAIVIAVYFYCETYTIVYTMPDARVTYLCDMMSFALIVPTLFLSVLHGIDGKAKNLFKFMVGLGLFNIVFQLVVCGLFNLATFRKMLWLTHIVDIAGIIVVLCSTILSLSSHRFKEEYFSLDLIFLGAIGGLLDIVLFYLNISENNVFFFKIALLFYFARDLFRIVKTVVKKSNSLLKEEFYKNIAMHDSLTNCFSRVAYDLECTAWDKYAKAMIFSIDVNNFKDANDKYGHNVGDKLLVELARILKITFDKVGDCYRVGGDEFIVICLNMGPVEAKSYIEKLRELEKEVNNQEELETTLSFAVGNASTGECWGNLEMAIELAESRMSINKNEIKGLINENNLPFKVKIIDE